jgi:hypothetical protein
MALFGRGINMNNDELWRDITVIIESEIGQTAFKL